MPFARKAALAVVALLVLAGGVFGVRSVLDSEPGSGESAAPNTVPTLTATPTPSASSTPTSDPSDEDEEPEPTASPTPTRTEPTPEPTPTRTAPPARSTRATGAVRSEITSSLSSGGRAASVWCPPTVPAAVGTTFTCTVAYRSDPAVVVAEADVRITTADGNFTWTSRTRG